MPATSPRQLTFEAASVAVEHVPSRQAPLSRAQHAVLRLIAEREVITSTDAGVIVHAFRPCLRCRDGRRCDYRSADGLSILRRLEDRGLVRKVGRGRWAANVIQMEEKRVNVQGRR